MEETRTNVQTQPISLESLEEKKIPSATSYTQLEIELQQPPLEKGMRIQELMAKHVNKGKNMVEMPFEGQHEGLPSNLEVFKEEENLSYNEEITSRGNEELEKFQTVENDAQTLETLVVKEDELTSPKSHEKIKDELVKTILETAPWGEMHEELKNEKMIPILKAEECTIQFFKEMEATIVNTKKKIGEKKNNERGRLCAQVAD